ncbi:hypothetical protein GJ496_004347 [Pomphorhynchus laevis]|nr:hypothetical protein GJ496_004347 [Pomphorhynchus laevis]
MDDRVNFYDRLFKFCITANSTPTSDSSTTNLQGNAENMTWLREALNEIVTSPIEMVKICIRALENEANTEEDKDLRIQSIITLNEWLEDIDVTKGTYVCYKLLSLIAAFME